jgi:hypothetical protein
MTTAPKNEWRHIAMVACHHCNEEFVTDPTRRYVAVDHDSVDWTLVCGTCQHASRLQAFLHDGVIHLTIGALPVRTPTVTPVESEPVQAAPAEPEPEPEPKPEPEPEPNVAAELANAVWVRRHTQARAALYAIASLVKTRSRNNLVFADKNAVIGRYAKLYGHSVWAINVNHPDVTRILKQHGGKATLLDCWVEMKIIHTVNRTDTLAPHRTVQVALTPNGRTRCVLFYAKALKNATESTAPANTELFA